MLVSIEKAAAYIGTDIDMDELTYKMLALEASIRKYTNNNFQNRNVRVVCEATKDVLVGNSPLISAGDTVQITNSKYNDGLYVVEEVTESGIKLDKSLYDEGQVLVTKVEYPADVQMGALEILRWKFKNETQNYDPNAEREVQSESISRHSITYAKDTTESDLDIEFGVPKKYTAFLRMYKKARV